MAELFLARCRRLGIDAMATRVALTDTCGFTAQSTQVVKLRASDAAALYEIDVIDDCCVQWEDSFNANTKTRLSHRDRFARAAMFSRNHDAFKSLQSFFGLRFFNPHVHTDR